MSVKEIEERLQFIELNEGQKRALKAARPIAERCIERALDRFYTRARITPETARFFRDSAQMDSAKSAQMLHWKHILDARFDEIYYASVRRIGAVHARIGLEPRWYIGGYALVLEELLRGLKQARPMWRRLLGISSHLDIANAVVKAALLDMELSVSVYFEEGESARNQAIARLDEALARLAGGDLAHDCTGLPASFASLEHSYNQTLSNLRMTIGSTVAASLTIQDRSQEIAESSEHVARRTESNAAALEQAAVTLTQVDGRVKTTASGARETLSIADEALLAMGHGKQAADYAVQTMHGVNESARGIDAVIRDQLSDTAETDTEATLTQSLDAIRTGNVRMANSLSGIDREASQVADILHHSTSDVDCEAEIGPALLDAVEAMTARTCSAGSEPKSESVTEDAADLIEGLMNRIAARYTMAREREIHRPFASSASDFADMPDVSAATTDIGGLDDDDLFDDALF